MFDTNVIHKTLLENVFNDYYPSDKGGVNRVRETFKWMFLLKTICSILGVSDIHVNNCTI